MLLLQFVCKLLDHEDEGNTIRREVGKYPAMLCCIPEDLNRQQHRCENLKSHITNYKVGVASNDMKVRYTKLRVNLSFGSEIETSERTFELSKKVSCVFRWHKSKLTTFLIGSNV
jgi:hypothetical protein